MLVYYLPLLWIHKMLQYKRTNDKKPNDPGSAILRRFCLVDDKYTHKFNSMSLEHYMP